jgi:hypothetical protein
VSDNVGHVPQNDFAPRAHAVQTSFAVVLLVAAAGLAAAQPPANQQARSLKEFGDRVQAYMELRETLARSVAPVTKDATPDQIVRHQQELAAAIRRARQDVKPGELFTPPVVPQFRTIIRNDLRSRDVRDAMATLQEVPAIELRVNAAWPPDTPRATMPPRLLASLYPLPKGLEYRFVSRHLVLVDDEASLIVDFIRDVVPSVVSRRK